MIVLQGMLGALLLAAQAPAAAQDDVDPMVALIAANAQERVDWGVPGLVRLTGARGEGRTLILDVDLAPEAPEQVGPPHIASMFTTAICAEPGAAAFFSDGRQLRVQVSRAGRAEASVMVDRCTGPVGGGLTAAAFAAGLEPFVGQQFGDVTIAAIRAEENVMIVTQAAAAGRPGTAASHSEAFVRGFCTRPEVQTAFFGRGLILRVDTRVGEGDPVPGPPVTACPAQ